MIIKNTVYNLLGLGLPLLVAVVSMPVLIHSLGDARFGVLTLIWAVVSYFGLFDLGLGRALTQQLSVLIAAERDEEIAPMVFTSLLMMTGLGLLASALLWFGAELGARSISHASDSAEIIGSIRVMAIAMPFIVLTTGFRGILEAKSAFGIINLIRLPMGLFTFLGPLAIVLWYKNDLVAVTAVLTLGRVIACLVHAYFAARCLPGMLNARHFNASFMKPLLVSGGWMTVTNIISPLMSYLDRFLISTTISAAAVAYYVTPNEMITKIWIIPGALTAVLFPAFSSQIGSGRSHELMDLYRRSVLYLLLAITPMTLIIAFASKEILTLWVGAAFAEQSSSVLRIFSYGVLISSITQIPFSLLQGAGKAALTAKVHVVEFPVYCLLLWLSCSYYGLEGAALVWLLRICADGWIMFYFSFDILEIRFTEVFGKKFIALMTLITLSFASTLIPLTGLKIWQFSTCLAIIAAYMWFSFLSENERLLSKRKVYAIFGK